MGNNGETDVVVISNSTEDAKPAEDYPYGTIVGSYIDIEGGSALVDFEVIEIVDDRNPYPTHLGID